MLLFPSFFIAPLPYYCMSTAILLRTIPCQHLPPHLQKQALPYLSSFPSCFPDEELATTLSFVEADAFDLLLLVCPLAMTLRFASTCARKCSSIVADLYGGVSVSVAFPVGYSGSCICTTVLFARNRERYVVQAKFGQGDIHGVRYGE